MFSIGPASSTIWRNVAINASESRKNLSRERRLVHLVDGGDVVVPQARYHYS